MHVTHTHTCRHTHTNMAPPTTNTQRQKEREAQVLQVYQRTKRHLTYDASLELSLLSFLLHGSTFVTGFKTIIKRRATEM